MPMSWVFLCCRFSKMSQTRSWLSWRISTSNYEVRVWKVWESGFPAFVIRTVVKFLYLVQIQEATHEENQKIMEMANFCGLVKMVDAYGKKVGDIISKENAVDFLVIAKKTNAIELKKKCLDFIAKNECDFKQDRHNLDTLGWDLLVEVFEVKNRRG